MCIKVPAFAENEVLLLSYRESLRSLASVVILAFRVLRIARRWRLGLLFVFAFLNRFSYVCDSFVKWGMGCEVFC